MTWPRPQAGLFLLKMVDEVGTGFRAPQEPTQRSLALKQRARSQVLAVQLEQIERPEERLPIVLATVQPLEVGNAGPITDFLAGRWSQARA